MFTVTYEVHGSFQHLSHGDAIFPVQGGAIQLPYGESWYKDLVDAGILVQVGERVPVPPAKPKQRPPTPIPDPATSDDDGMPEITVNLLGE